MQPDIMHPVIKKLAPDDFEQVFLSVEPTPVNPLQHSSVFPNPANDVIHIPMPEIGETNRRFRIIDARGLIVTDHIVNTDDSILRIDISRLKPGIYQGQYYTADGVLQSEKFIKY